MIPTPTVEAVLIMAALAALTEGMSERKCSRFRVSMRDRLRLDNPNIRFIRESIPGVQEMQDKAVTLLRVGCNVCPRSGRCSAPLA